MIRADISQHVLLLNDEAINSSLNSPEELLPLQLVQLRDDVVEGPLDPGDDDVLDGVDAPVRDLDHLVERDEGGLQRRQLHQQLHGARVVLFQDLRGTEDFSFLSRVFNARDLTLVSARGAIPISI